ncbi:MAG: hypothetical protein ABGW50_05390 [Thermococcus sp.]
MKPWLGGSRPVLKHEGQHVVPVNGPWMVAFDPKEVQVVAVGEFLVIWPSAFEYDLEEALRELLSSTKNALDTIRRKEARA